METQSESDLAHGYIERQDQIGVLKAECEQIKDVLKARLPHIEGGEKSWKFADTHVEWVKGRTSEKLDANKLRVALVMAGVTMDVLEKAFKSATSTSTGDPSIRISRLKVE